MLIQMISGLTFISPLFSRNPVISSFFPNWFALCVVCSCSLMSCRKVELVMGTKKLAKLLVSSALTGQACAFVLHRLGMGYQVNLLNTVSALQVLRYSTCPWDSVLELSDNIKFGSGAFAIVTILGLSCYMDDFFNSASAVVFSLCYMKWIKIRKTN